MKEKIQNILDLIENINGLDYEEILVNIMMGIIKIIKTIIKIIKIIKTIIKIIREKKKEKRKK